MIQKLEFWLKFIKLLICCSLVILLQVWRTGVTIAQCVACPTSRVTKKWLHTLKNTLIRKVINLKVSYNLHMNVHSHIHMYTQYLLNSRLGSMLLWHTSHHIAAVADLAIIAYRNLKLDTLCVSVCPLKLFKEVFQPFLICLLSVVCML
jgi:hypothetical protein